MLPTIGSKELVASLPDAARAAGAGDVVVIPELAYPTYEVGARMAGATVVRADATSPRSGPEPVALIWLNSPSNPTGRVLPVEHLRQGRGVGPRARHVVVASDECYIDLGVGNRPGVDPAPGGLRRRSHQGLLAVHSLSKRSNMAGYRAGFVSGDPDADRGAAARCASTRA